MPAAGPSVVLLHRRSPVGTRSSDLQRLESLGAAEIISVETGPRPLDLESLSADHPRARFLLLPGRTDDPVPRTPRSNLGRILNLAMREARRPWVLVVWSDTSVRRLPEAGEPTDVVLVPNCRSLRRDPVPTIGAPAIHRRRLRIIRMLAEEDNGPSLYPFDSMGLYNRELFGRIGGYDEAIQSTYWQRLDFGFRCFLWGYRISSRKNFLVDYESETEAEDASPRNGYRRFFLKNLAVRRGADKAVLPFRRIIPFLMRTDGGLVDGVRTFRSVQSWVETHRYHFKMDASGIAELWEV